MTPPSSQHHLINWWFIKLIRDDEWLNKLSVWLSLIDICIVSHYLPEVFSAIVNDWEIGVLVVLQLRDDPEYVVHLDLPLARLHAARVGVRHVHVDEIGEIEAEVGGARHVLHGDTVHVIAQTREILLLREQLRQFVETGFILLKKNWGRIHVDKCIILVTFRDSEAQVWLRRYMGADCSADTMANSAFRLLSSWRRFATRMKWDMASARNFMLPYRSTS